MQKNLIWFRNDLRISDNTALYQSCINYQDYVIALFISTPKQWNNHRISKKKISFIYHHVISLQKQLSKLNIVLYYHECTDFLNSIEYLIHFCKKYKINNLFYNYQYEINERSRDSFVKEKLSKTNILVNGFHDSLLVPPNYIKNKQNATYKNFYFFKKKIIKQLSNKIPTCFPMPYKRLKNNNFFSNHFSFSDLICNFDTDLFPIGEQKAIYRLKSFCKNKIKNYSFERNFPFLNSTSMISPYLSLGIISSRYCLSILLQTQNNINLNRVLNLSWFNEILWREFYYHLLIGFPQISQSKTLSTWEKNINWSNNDTHFSAWKKGETGFPIIDAGMRQLNQLGWMHNRLRMITASFLVKNLLIDWRKGEEYFISHLIDGDLALNNGGWQWAASTGNDSVPYTRIFNPWTQSKIFDASGVFIKKFIPELKKIPINYIHNPHKWLNKTIDYPKPIINYSESRKKALLIFNNAKLFS